MQYAYAGLAQAYEDGSPVLCITDGVPAGSSGNSQYDVASAMKTVSKWFGYLDKPERTPELRWRSSSWRPSSGTASNAAMPSRSTPAISGSKARTRSARAAAIWGPGAPYGHVHRQHRAAPRHGCRPAGQGSGRDCAGGIHHAKQWRLDHVRQTPELTACDWHGRSPARGDHSQREQCYWSKSKAWYLRRRSSRGVERRSRWHHAQSLSKGKFRERQAI